MLTNLFGHTDQDIRPLTLIDYTDNTIIVTEMVKDCIECDKDHYPMHIIFVKENNNWKIELFEYNVS